MGPQSITHALKLPFEKLGNAARRQLTAPHLSNSPEDGHNILRRHSPLHLRGSPPSQILPRDVYRRPNKTSTLPSPKVRETAGLFRRGDAILTDEEHREGPHESQLRKLFLKGGRAVLPDDRRLRRPESSVQANNDDRQAELRVLDTQVATESAFRSRQVEVPRRSQLEVDAMARIREVESELYMDRSA